MTTLIRPRDEKLAALIKGSDRYVREHYGTEEWLEQKDKETLEKLRKASWADTCIHGELFYMYKNAENAEKEFKAAGYRTHLGVLGSDDLKTDPPTWRIAPFSLSLR